MAAKKEPENERAVAILRGVLDLRLGSDRDRRFADLLLFRITKTKAVTLDASERQIVASFAEMFGAQLKHRLAMVPKVDEGRDEVTNLLELWGLYTVSGRLKRSSTGTGGEPGADEAFAAATWVESVPGFETAEPVLLWVYGHGKGAADFPVRLPKETLVVALIRLRWFRWHECRDDAEIPDRVVRWFLHHCRAHMIRRPFVSPAPPRDEQSGWEIGAVGAAELDTKLGKRRGPQAPAQSLRDIFRKSA